MVLFAGSLTSRSWKSRHLHVHTVIQCWVRRNLSAVVVRTTFHPALLR